MNWILMYCDYAYFRSGEDKGSPARIVKDWATKKKGGGETSFIAYTMRREREYC